MARGKGGRREKGTPAQWDELKLPRKINMTNTGWVLLEELAKAEDISKSELLERLVRRAAGELPS